MEETASYQQKFQQTVEMLHNRILLYAPKHNLKDHMENILSKMTRQEFVSFCKIYLNIKNEYLRDKGNDTLFRQRMLKLWMDKDHLNTLQRLFNQIQLFLDGANEPLKNRRNISISQSSRCRGHIRKYPQRIYELRQTSPQSSSNDILSILVDVNPIRVNVMELPYPSGISKKYWARDIKKGSNAFLAIFYRDTNEEVIEILKKQKIGLNTQTIGNSRQKIRCFMHMPSNEAAYVTTHVQEKNYTIPKKHIVDMRNVIEKNAVKLFTRHSNLNIIQMSAVKSTGWNTNSWTIDFKPTILFLCDKKHLIPMGENAFEKVLDGYPTDVREGWLMFNADHSRLPLIPTVNPVVRIGDNVSTVNVPLLQCGTVGTFAKDNTDHKVGFLTSSHIFSPVSPNQNELHNNMAGQPVLINRDLLGTIVRDKQFESYEFQGKTFTIDAAFVKLPDIAIREPKIVLSDEEICRYSELPPSFEIDTTMSTEVELAAGTVVYKFGFKTKLTKGLVTDGEAIGCLRPNYKDETVIQLGGDFRDVQSGCTDARFYLAKHLIPVLAHKDSSSRLFADKGDSGSVVFTYDKETQTTTQVGLITADHTDHTTMITPLIVVTRALNVTLTD